jgi:hypothetical protein
MGWGGGTHVMESLLDSMNEALILSDERRFVYRRMLKTLTDLDWDCVSECLGIDEVFDLVVEEMYPEWFHED